MVAFLAPPTGAVILAQCLMVFQSLCAHANASLPPRVETGLRPFFISPDVHRVHHSDRPEHYDSNFGDLFPWWDRLFGTYVASPAGRDTEIVAGIRGLQTPRSNDLWFMLTLPFRS